MVRLLLAIATSRDPASCIGGRIWTSRDPIDRKLAVTICREHCPFLFLCEEAADEEPAEAIDGVWAGIDRKPASLLRLAASKRARKGQG